MTTPPATNPYKRHRFPAEIISHCVWLYFRFSLSYRDVQEMMAERGPNTLGPSRLQAVVCGAEVAHADRAPLDRDIKNLKVAVERAGAAEAFMNSASPGVLVI